MTESRSLTDKFMLRLPDGMRERIKAAADANNRSMNAEIVQLLEREYPEANLFELMGSRIVRAIANTPKERRQEMAGRLDALLAEIEGVAISRARK